MKPIEDELEDLGPLARRRELSEADKKRFEALLAESPEERLLHELGVRFDEEDAETLRGAAVQEQRVVARVVERLEPKRVRPAAKRAPWLLAAALVLAASLAGAVVAGVRWFGAPGPLPSAPVASGLPRVAPPLGTVAPVAPPSAKPPPAASNVSAEAQPAPLSAAELLSAAGRARRSGQSERAIELLEKLQKRYPSSPEAAASEITLGKLELERGGTAAALRHYDGYLRDSQGGALAAEALWGRAQSLSRLGREAEARKTLTELLQRYRSSPYASSARAKLGTGASSP